MIERQHAPFRASESQKEAFERKRQQVRNRSALNTERELHENERNFDPLTGVLGAEKFGAEVRILLSRSAEGSLGPVSILFVDVDHFKRVNDTLGHDVGDEVLQKIASALADGVRKEKDIVCRLHGEEFAIALPGATEATAAEIAEQLRKKISGLTFNEKNLHVTASFGVATNDNTNPRTFEELLKSADQIMYKSKKGGRNLVTTESGYTTAPHQQYELDV